MLKGLYRIPPLTNMWFGNTHLDQRFHGGCPPRGKRYLVIGLGKLVGGPRLWSIRASHKRSNPDPADKILPILTDARSIGFSSDYDGELIGTYPRRDHPLLVPDSKGSIQHNPRSRIIRCRIT